MKKTLSAFVVACAVVAPAAAQTFIHVPDNAPPLTAGNTIPFASTAYTYMVKIPASYLLANDAGIDEVAMMPAFSGTFTAPNMLVGFGHLPAALPCPFSFPGPGAATIGSFLDFTVAYDSSVDGPFSWACTIDTWCPIGLAGLGGSGFAWNGVNDVGFYFTFSGASGGGSIRRAPTGPNTRTYASTYQAAASTACDALFAAYVRLTVSPAIQFQAITSGGGVGDLTLIGVPQAVAPSATQGFTFISFTPATPLGGGPAFGLLPDGGFWQILLMPAAIGNPLHFIYAPGFYPEVPLVLPAGTLTFLSGVTADFVQVNFDASFGYVSRSNVDRVTF